MGNAVAVSGCPNNDAVFRIIALSPVCATLPELSPEVKLSLRAEAMAIAAAAFADAAAVGAPATEEGPAKVTLFWLLQSSTPQCAVGCWHAGLPAADVQALAHTA